MAIVLHQRESRKSRDFVSGIPLDWEVAEYPDCVRDWPRIQGYPTVVIAVPTWHDAETSQDIPAHDELVYNPASVDQVRALIAAYALRAAEHPPEGD